MKLSILVILVTLWAGLIAGVWADDNDHHHGDDSDHHHHHHSAHATPVHVETFHGTPFPPSPRNNEPDGETPGPPIPTGKPRGPITPSSPGINLTIMGGGNSNTSTIIPHAKRQQCGGNGIVFDTSTVFGNGGKTSEPSGAKAGEVVFTTANWFAAISIDGGATFHTIDPTVYAGPANPATDGGFCCDQVVQYLPSIDRFVWLIQYVNNGKAINNSA